MADSNVLPTVLIASIIGGISGSVAGAASADFYRRQLEGYLELSSTGLNGAKGDRGLSAYEVWASEQPPLADTSITAFLMYLGSIPGPQGDRGSIITSEAVNPTVGVVTDNTTPQGNDHHFDTTGPNDMKLYKYFGTNWSLVETIPTTTAVNTTYMESLLQSSYHFRHTTPTGLSNKGFFLNQVTSTDEHYNSVPTNGHDSNTNISCLADNDLELSAMTISIKGASTGIGSPNTTDPMTINLILHSWHGNSTTTSQPINVVIPRAVNGINGIINGSNGSHTADSDIRFLVEIPPGIKVPMGYLFGLEFKTPLTPTAGTLADIDNANIKLIFKRDSISTLPLISY